jgi:hypothetical protein
MSKILPTVRSYQARRVRYETTHKFDEVLGRLAAHKSLASSAISAFNPFDSGQFFLGARGDLRKLRGGFSPPAHSASSATVAPEAVEPTNVRTQAARLARR